MVEKRFKPVGCRIKRNDTLFNFDFKTESDAELCCRLLNQMDTEKWEYIKKLDELAEWHKEHYGKSILDERLEFKSPCEKKNEQLTKMLDNVANYMQKEHKNMPLDDFTEWWNDIATAGLEGFEDYDCEKGIKEDRGTTARFVLDDDGFAIRDNVDGMKCHTLNCLKKKMNILHEENLKLREENEKLRIENQGQSDAIDGLQEMMAHYNLEEL